MRSKKVTVEGRRGRTPICDILENLWNIISIKNKNAKEWRMREGEGSLKMETFLVGAPHYV